MNAPVGTPLSQPLPAEVQVDGEAPWTRYRRYPVFSAAWLRGRTLLFAVVVGIGGALTALALWMDTGRAAPATLAGLNFVAAFLVMSSIGPALATAVRHRRWPVPRERAGVVAAVLLGVGLSYFADMYASSVIAQALPVERPTPVREVAPLLRGVMGALNVVVLAVVYGLFGGGLALRAYFSEQRRLDASRHQAQLQRSELERQQADARLGVLQAQVEPHFLFNTLASIRALVRADPARAEATLDALVEHLRATIPVLRAGEAGALSTLGQQLDICTSYLELMCLRTGGRLSYAVEVDPALRARAFPPLLLITLVENAVKHGVEPHPGPGRVTVRAQVLDGQLHVQVHDDGRGLVPGVGGGMGLANVRAQLATRYGDAAGLQLASAAAGGTLATLHLPLDPA